MNYFTGNLTPKEERLRALSPDRVLIAEFAGDRPEIVCLCGSTRFREEFARANRELTRAGVIVVAPGVFGHSGDPFTDDDKQRLDELHRRKIDLADRVVIVSDASGYIGDSTRAEIEYARVLGKPVGYLFPAAEQDGEVSR
ncbi:hypothetical protein ACFWYW_58930 [Nonomuraea sp. NPDC059023]|uniref:hypothetical protein n=1 Tax=unclassified Nonomuraea TaxID=2593643 RepID=UPI00368460FA